MTVQQLHHVGIVVDDLPAAIGFFVELGLDLEGEASLGGPWVDRIIGLEGTRSDIAMLVTPNGTSRIELSKFHSPSGPEGDPRVPSNAKGLRHLAFLVDGLDEVLGRLRARGVEPVGNVEQYEDIYRLCFLRGPEGIIIGLAEQLS